MKTHATLSRLFRIGLIAAFVAIAGQSRNAAMDEACGPGRCGWHEDGKLVFCGSECSTVYPSPNFSVHCDGSLWWPGE